MRNLFTLLAVLLLITSYGFFSLTSAKTPKSDVLLKDFKLRSPNDAVSSNEGSDFWIAVQDGKIAEIIDITQQTILPKGKTELL